MPLPKAPSKPAQLVDLNTAVLATELHVAAPAPVAKKAANNPKQARLLVQPVASPDISASDDLSKGSAASPAASAKPAKQAPAKKGPATPKPEAPAVKPVQPRKSKPVDVVNAPAALTQIETRAPAPPVKPEPTISGLAKAATRRASGSRGARAASRREEPNEQTTLFVLDTNVLMHDPTCLFRFAEHDVFLPIVTLEELDDHKKGSSEVSRNVRTVSRTLDALIDTTTRGLDPGVELSALGDKSALGKLLFENQNLEFDLPESLSVDKPDNQILRVVAALKQREPDRDVVLVSKDINMRIKANMLGLAAEDYFNDLVIEDTDLLEPGMLALPADFWDQHGKGMESWQDAGHTLYRLSGPLLGAMYVNQFVYFDGELPLNAQVIERTERHVVLKTVKDYSHHKNSVWGIVARNREQNYALNLLCDPDIDFVSLLGQAGTGKTLLALAAGLNQVMDHNRYTEIIVTRATVPVGDDIGFLPGTEEEKMQPWMGALEDNLEVLNNPDPAAGDWGRSATQDLINARIKIKSLSFMRGRTFVNKFLIIDEAQNLTPKQMKTLITRAGPGTKVVCLGNIAQIDTPYLTEASSGLSFVVDRMRGWAHGGHITLQRGERSRLADHAARVL